MLCVPQHPVLGVVLGQRCGDVSAQQKLLVLLGQVVFGRCSSLAHVLAMNPFLKPVGNERA